MANALLRLSEEDPTFRVHSDENTGQTIISGMGELHLDVLVDRMLREFRVQANIGNPRVSYRETITNPQEFQLQVCQAVRRPRAIRHVVFDLEPWTAVLASFLKTKYLWIHSKRVHPAVEKGVKEAVESVCWVDTRH